MRWIFSINGDEVSLVKKIHDLFLDSNMHQIKEYYTNVC